jgi:hypothetical protein
MLQLRCIVCHIPFDFAHQETAVVVRHIAYGYDFVHPRHEATALSWIFVDPEYDRPEFTHDARRARILDVAPPDGWAAVVPETPERTAAGDLVSFQPLGLWALVELHDRVRYIEGLVREREWESEPGGAEFPEGDGGPRDAVGYAPTTARPDALQLAHWEAIVQARYRGEQVPASRNLPRLDLPHQALVVQPTASGQRTDRDARLPGTAVLTVPQRSRP